MSLISALYTGVSGLQTFGDTLQVIGDNIANVNTVGFKSSRAEFTDIFSQSINVASGRAEIGRGVTMQDITQNFAQGSFTNTDRLTDLAINGNGFFMVRDANGSSYYTRNGQLTLSKDGTLMTNSGMRVMGYQLDGGNNFIQPIRINQAITQAKPTGTGTPTGSGANLHMNLNAKDPIKNAFSVTDPAATSNFSTSITVYDTLGVGHTVDVYMNKTADNTWQWHALVNGSELTGGTSGTYQEITGGTLTFNESGALNAVTINPTSPTYPNAFSFRGTTTPQTIGFSFGDPIATGGTGLEGTTQFGNPNVMINQYQDGYSAGNLTAITVDEYGVITGSYTNGQTTQIAQVALANFNDPQGLVKAGGGLFAETPDSGQPVINRPGIGGVGTISSHALEMSNVDLANEFVNLISTQRAYQANSKVITTGDQLLSEIVNIIR